MRATKEQESPRSQSHQRARVTKEHSVRVIIIDIEEEKLATAQEAASRIKALKYLIIKFDTRATAKGVVHPSVRPSSRVGRGLAAPSLMTDRSFRLEKKEP